jgi:hypothetical protein
MAEGNTRKRPPMDHKKIKTRTKKPTNITIEQHVIGNYQLPKQYNKDNTLTFDLLILHSNV